MPAKLVSSFSAFSVKIDLGSPTMVQEWVKKIVSPVELNCYCAFCRTPRRIYQKHHLSFSDVFLSALTSVVIMMLVWHGIDARVLMIFVWLLSACEFFIQIRWRLSLPCPHCAFDPLIYLKDQARAAEKVKAHLEKRRQDPMVLFSARPHLNLPMRKVESGRRIKVSGSRLNRTI